jgi:hypothetical protein
VPIFIDMLQKIKKLIRVNESGQVCGRVRILQYKAGTKELIKVSKWYKNRVVSSDGYGRNILIRRLAGNVVYTGQITHGSIGTGTTAVSDSDTGLETEAVRSQVGSTIINNNVITFRFFFSDSLTPNDTYNEFGTFIDGTVTLGTGRLFNRLIFAEAYEKASGVDTTIELVITLNP